MLKDQNFGRNLPMNENLTISIRQKFKSLFAEKNEMLNFFCDIFLFLFLCTKTGFGKSAILEVISLGGFITLIGVNIIKNKRKVKISQYNIWYITFSVFACLSYFWAMNKEYVLKMFPSIIALSVFTLALSNYVDSKEQFNKFLNIFVFSNICAAVKILMLYFFQSRNTSR